MKNKVLYIQHNPETGLWEEYKEPYMTIECPTKEDYFRLEQILDDWKNQPQWHDAKSDPPKEPGEYIVAIKDSETATTLSFRDGSWVEVEDHDDDCWYTYYNVTHWMPLPKPPAKEG